MALEDSSKLTDRDQTASDIPLRTDFEAEIGNYLYGSSPNSQCMSKLLRALSLVVKSYGVTSWAGHAVHLTAAAIPSAVYRISSKKMISVSIPNFKQVANEDEKPYTVYQVHVRVAIKTHVIEKRYSEFHTLHKQVKKRMETPDFPPKRMRQLTLRGIEQRRQGLQQYLQVLLDKDHVPKSLLTFLRVNNFKSVSNDSLDDLGSDLPSSSHHQPVMCFQEDAYLQPTSCDSGLPDVLDAGVRQGLYKDELDFT